MAESWDKQDFEELARLHLGPAVPPGNRAKDVQTFFQEAFTHYDEATADGKDFIDKALANTVNFFESKLQDIPDTADARRLRRIIGRGKGKHLSAETLVDNFPVLPSESDERIDEAKKVLCTVLQCLLDLLHDATQNPQDGAAKISILGLFYWLVDELIVAQFLARRRYATLAYSHLRSCLEILDKIELFTLSPEWVDLWGSDNEKEIWDKLSPPRVREKLSRSSLDPMYKYFSGQGAHATFKGLQQRLRDKRRSPEDEIEIAIGVGGIREPPRQASILIYCILVASQAIVKAATAFEDRLHPEDVRQLVTSTIAECSAFFKRFLGSVDRSKDDISSLEIILATWQEMLDEGKL